MDWQQILTGAIVLCAAGALIQRWSRWWRSGGTRGGACSGCHGANSDTNMAPVIRPLVTLDQLRASGERSSSESSSSQESSHTHPSGCGPQADVGE